MLWNVKDRNGRKLKRGDHILLNGEPVKVTYLTATKMIVRRSDRLEELRLMPYRGRLSNVEKVTEVMVEQ